MRSTVVAPGIYHIKFTTQYEATSTFMRLQEFYECPSTVIRGRYFTFSQFMDNYARRHGNFTYCVDFAGFNVPDRTVRKFFLKFEDLSSSEKKLKAIVDKIDDEKFYLIGTYDVESVNHELAHAFWYLIPEYKREMKELLEKCTIRKSLVKRLRKVGYRDGVMDDEIQAYLGAESLSYLRRMFPFRTKWKMVPDYRKIFKKHRKRYLAIRQ